MMKFEERARNAESEASGEPGQIQRSVRSSARRARQARIRPSGLPMSIHGASFCERSTQGASPAFALRSQKRTTSRSSPRISERARSEYQEIPENVAGLTDVPESKRLFTRERRPSASTPMEFTFG